MQKLLSLICLSLSFVGIENCLCTEQHSSRKILFYDRSHITNAVSLSLSTISDYVVYCHFLLFIIHLLLFFLFHFHLYIYNQCKYLNLLLPSKYFIYKKINKIHSNSIMDGKTNNQLLYRIVVQGVASIRPYLYHPRAEVLIRLNFCVDMVPKVFCVERQKAPKT